MSADVSTSSAPNWVRSWDTSVAVAKSQAELEALLRRYGAHGYTISQDYRGGTVVLAFTLPRTWQLPAAQVEPIEIKLAVSFGEVRRRLEQLGGFRTKVRSKRDGGVWAREQPEKVAWRHVLLFVAAGLEAAASGIQTVEEAFFAHSVLPGTGRRVIDVVDEQRQQLITAGARA